MYNKRLFVDMDGTLARFHDATDYLEHMYEEGFFRNLEPFENMVEGIRQFIKDHPDVEVYTCSAVIRSPHCINDKNAWMDKYLPEIPLDHRIYTEIGHSKAEYIEGGITKDDYLLDDYNKGLHQFVYSGGSAIKCHNNINQLGRGAHGGESGYMWEGAMIHSENVPELISEELAQLMGIEHDIEKAAKACGVNYYRHNNSWNSMPANAPYDDCKYKMCIIEFSDMYIARREGSIFYLHFENPFNALRFITGDKLASEYNLSYEFKSYNASGYQLEAICMNAFGTTDFDNAMSINYPKFINNLKKALEHREDAVVGYVYGLNPDGSQSSLIPCYNHSDIKKIADKFMSQNQAYKVELFISPQKTEHEKKQNSLDNMLKDAASRITVSQINSNPSHENNI